MGPSSSCSSPPSREAAEDLRMNRILSSKLYLNVAPSKVAVIYSPSYDIAFLGIEKLHPFDSSKWGRICQFLTNEHALDKNSIVEPLEASKDDLLVVHPESYLDRLKSSVNVSMIIEVPPVAMLPNCLVQQKVLHPFRLQVGGSILAAKLAKEQGWAINVGGGFHHCSAEKGGGFCVYADITLCIQYAFVRLNISRVMIIDLDAHQGNGHETDFSNDRRVYIMDMYNSQIYPLDYEARRYIDQKIELVSGTRTKEYLEELDRALEVARNQFDPELLVYNAGTDILDGDPLGRLKVSSEGVVIRDEKVFRFAKEKNVPIVMLTSDYGSIPLSSSPTSLDFISRAKQRGQSALSTRRPWREMIQPHAFSLPLSLGDAYLRIRTNAAYFSMNYAISVVFVVFLSLLFHPVSLLVYVAVIAAWIFLFFLRDQSLVIGGRTFEESYVLIGLSVLTIVLLLITNSTLDIIGSVATGIVVVLVHAVLRRTDDLPVDEEAAAAGGWYAVAGESSSKTSPVS